MYYVYCYFNPLKSSNMHECGFEPFYVGKGKNNRAIHHLFESHIKNDSNKMKTNTILKIKKANLEPLIKIIAQYENEIDAFNEEKRLIKLWGRRDLNLGPLSNMTDGGDGSSNKVFSDEYRKKLSDGTKRAFAAGLLNSNIEAFKYSKLGKKENPEVTKKRVASRAGYTHSEETKAKIAASNALARTNPEWKIKASNAQKGKKHSVEHINKCILNNPRSTPVEVNGKSYLSMNSAVKELNMTPNKIKKMESFKFL